MDLYEKGLDVVAFEYEGEKYCRDCFRQLPAKTIKFIPILRAVIVQSSIKNCCKCGKDLSNVQDQARNQQG